MRVFNEKNVSIVKSSNATFSAMPKDGHVQFFIRSANYEELIVLLEKRLIELALQHSDIEFKIDYNKLRETYKDIM